MNLNFQPVPKRVDGEQMPRLGGNVFDFLAQFHIN